MLNGYYLLLCSLFTWACLLSSSHDFFFFFIPCSPGLQCGTHAHIHSSSKVMLMPWMVGLPEIREEEVFRALWIFSSTLCKSQVAAFEKDDVWADTLGLWLWLAGCCCFRHMVSGRGSGKLTKHRSLKWLLALWTKIGGLSADRETSGICSNSFRTLRFQTTKLSLIFYSIFWDQAIKKKNTNKYKKCRSLKSQVVHLNKNKMKKHLSSSL